MLHKPINLAKDLNRPECAKCKTMQKKKVSEHANVVFLGILGNIKFIIVGENAG